MRWLTISTKKDEKGRWYAPYYMATEGNFSLEVERSGSWKICCYNTTVASGQTTGISTGKKAAEAWWNACTIKAWLEQTLKSDNQT